MTGTDEINYENEIKPNTGERNPNASALQDHQNPDNSSALQISKSHRLLAERAFQTKRLNRHAEFLNSIHDSSITGFEIDARIFQLKDCKEKYENLYVEIAVYTNYDEGAENEYFRFEDMYSEIMGRYLSLKDEKSNHGISISSSRDNLNETTQKSHEPYFVPMKLPELKLPTFNGQFKKWVSFRDSFLSMIHTNAKVPEIHKFYYLLGALENEPHDLIGKIEFSIVGYNQAWKTLCDRYDNKRLIAESHISELFNLQTMTRESAVQLRNLVDSCNNHILSLGALDVPVAHWDLIITHIIASRLDKDTRKLWEAHTPNIDFPKWTNMKEFLNTRCRVLESIENTQSTYARNSIATPPARNNTKSSINNNYKPTKSFLTASVSRNMNCNFCSNVNDHYSSQCPHYLKLASNERFNRIKELHLCLNCLRTGHGVEKCVSSKCQKCHRKHNSTLHDYYSSKSDSYEITTNNSSPKTQTSNANPNAQSSTSAAGTSKSVCCMSPSTNTQVLISTALIMIKDVFGKYHQCRAILDSASHRNFITKAFADKLGIPTCEHYEPVSALNDLSTKIKNKIMTSFKSRINSYCQEVEFLIIPKITSYLPSRHIPLDNIHIPSEIELADPQFNIPSKIDALLGAKYFYAILTGQKLKISDLLPELQSSQLGYIIGGECSENVCLTITTDDDANEKLSELVEKFWELDSIPSASKLSEEEEKCEQHFINTHTRNELGRYVVQIPFRMNLDQLGESKHAAFQRFSYLEKKLERNPELKTAYTEFMKEYEQLGHMKRVTESNDDDTQASYLPHHCVIKPSSTTTKLRVVFDASCKTTTGFSLNDTMMIGPVVQNDLMAILLRFRTHAYVFSADVEKMYRQIEIHPSHQRFQRILWRYSSDEPISTYELKTVTYGTTAAPYLATRTLNQIAVDEGQNFPYAASIIKDFYVDDVMTGAPDEKSLIELKTQLCSMLATAGMNLRKFSSNCNELLSQISSDDKEVVKNLDDLALNHVIKALGLLWHPSDDNLLFIIQNIKIDTHVNHITKRTVLSSISKVFDPLGLLAPIIVTAKIFMQKMWNLKLNWDTILPPNELNYWIQFCEAFMSLPVIKIPRRIVREFPHTLELHGFSDASEIAYGACIYLRAINRDGEISSQLVCSKSRVAPLKHTTIPRLELCAAVLLAKLTQKTIESLGMQFHEVILYSDSMIVLAWINTPTHLLKSYVASRVAEIQKLTTSMHWRHIDTRNNPADIVSRGLMPHDLVDNRQWWNEAAFLLQPEIKADYSRPNLTLIELPELKQQSSVNLLATELAVDTVFSKLIAYHSSFRRLSRIAAYIMKFINSLRKTQRVDTTNTSQILTAIDLREGLNKLNYTVQATAFHRDIAYLRKHGDVHRRSNLKSFSPFLDADGIMRVGGRIKNSNLPFEQKHPILLPYDSHYTTIIFQHYHAEYHHCGPQALLCHVRTQFWPVKGKSIAKRVVSRCLVCAKVKPTSFQQLMGQLPADRVLPSRAFSIVGIDYCGPFLTRAASARSTASYKTYIGIFVCFATKAVHIEVISDLTTAAFISALRRFIARRGCPSTIYSDNAKNFVGAKNIIDALQEFFEEQQKFSPITSFCVDKGIRWKFIPPRSPHFGALWEAGVKSIKHHLKRVASHQPMTFEELTTLTTQIEACLNSRPITPISDDPNDDFPLTPAHLIMGASYTAFPDPNLRDVNIGRLTRWKRLQHMLQSFWDKWSSEYLQSLQHKVKWNTKCPNVKIGDIVLVHQENLPHASWILGRVTELHPGKDDLVRVVSVRTKRGIIKRAITKICPLPIET